MISNNIFIFTAGNAAARSHLSDSITNPIDLSAIESSLSDSELKQLRQLESKQNDLFAWGAVPGERNIPNWESLKAGDTILTVYDNHYHYICKVLFKTRNKQAAKNIWGTDPQGNTWELMYFLTEPRKISPALHIEDSALSLYLNRAYRGFTKIGSEKISKILSEFGTIDQFFEAALSQLGTTSMEKAGLLTDLILEAEGAYNPSDKKDAREKVLRSIAQRQGQPKFRKDLLAAYHRKCAITGFDVEQTLEAAHIQPYKGEHTNHIQNGLLLRSDIHSLFDKELLTIDPNDWSIHLHPSLSESSYSLLDEGKLRLPSDVNAQPNKVAFIERNRELPWFN